MLIRSETTTDHAAIHALTRSAFATAPHHSGTEQDIIVALRQAGALAVSLVAELDGSVVGHVALSAVTISDGSAGWYGLGPISVLPDHQGHGIGSALMQAALEALRTGQAAGCVLVGDPNWYIRFGFMADPALQVPGVPAEYVLSLHLHDASATGTVQYHPAFSTAE